MKSILLFRESGLKWIKVDVNGLEMFRGSSFHTIDPKGRIIIPARFRDVIKADGAGSIMITRMDNCLFAYTHAEWSKLEQKILDIQVKSEVGTGTTFTITLPIHDEGISTTNP